MITSLTKEFIFGQNIAQMSDLPLRPVLERQLLLQLGDRLKRLRKAQGLGTVEMAAPCWPGMSCNPRRRIPPRRVPAVRHRSCK
jgi:hypothetical protein